MEAAEVFVDDFLAHFGVKGMKWGVRKAVHPNLANVPKKTRKEAAKDAEEFTRAKLFYGEGAGTRRKLIKAKVEAKKAKDPLYSKAFDHFVARTDLGQRASQARSQRRRKDTTKAGRKALRRAGGLQGLVTTAAYLTQSRIDAGEKFLEHFGTKGMKWGVRKQKSSQVTVSQKGRKLQTSGGFRRPAHPDAIRVAKIGQVGKASGVKALSDDDLKAFQSRMNLEANVQRIQYNRSNPARKFVLNLLGESGKQALQQATNEAAAQQVKAQFIKRGLLKEVAKKGAKAAAAAA